MNDRVSGGGAAVNNYTLFNWPGGPAGVILAIAVLVLAASVWRAA